MKRSQGRILTSHVGSLPRPEALLEINRAKFAGAPYDEKAYAERLSGAVDEICRKQAEIGIDVINDGEFGKTSSGAIDYGAWSSYAWGRLRGWQPGELGRLPALAGRRDRLKFAEFYRELDTTSFRSSSSMGGRPPVFVSPIEYVGQRALSADLANFKASLGKVNAEEGFITSVAPGSFARRQNEYYQSEEEFLHALAEAMRQEYKAIVEAGFVLQLDDPGLPDTWDMANPEPSVEDYQKFAMLRVEALNHALRGLPEERIRYHICWGSWHGPHTTDLPLRNIVDVLLKVRAGAYSIEAGNVRHEHEWKVWRDIKLPDGRILIPGVVSHATNVVEHPEVVADRILNFAKIVGRERVIAGTDCGLGGRIHPQLVWAKLESLVAGANLASKELWPS
jgi:5-methyltetrahydropteroyltriglutamate--homocysteine methyltransferase